MNRLLTYITVLGVMAIGMSSCTIKQKAVPLAPMNAQVNFDMDDLEFIGDATGSSTQSFVIGIPYGGRKYHSGVLVNQLGLGIPSFLNRGYNNAMYDALMQMPNADFVLPVAYDTTTEMQFLGRKVYLNVRCKAYRIKNQ